MNKISVGILGATGTVGQRFIQLLADHPWFEVTALAASERSAGLRFADACHWLLPLPMPESIGDILVEALEPGLDCRLVFSALPSSVAQPVEERFAEAGYVVCTNAAPHRLASDVPLLIPEVNADHTHLIDRQRDQRRWKGFIVASANCTTTQLALALKPLHDTFGLSKLSVVTLQAISGAGYPGVPAADILGNVIPYIPGEEEKVESESRKLLGRMQNGQIVDASLVVSAHCNRVPVHDGHTECVSVGFIPETSHQRPSVDDVIATFQNFRAPAEVVNLPSSPLAPIAVLTENDRPQPLRDRDLGNGMAISVGRVRPCPILDVKFVVLGHNTLRGAAGGAIHNAELLVAQKRIE
jgi:aspartate-semialdehyde dehydrogenase